MSKVYAIVINVRLDCEICHKKIRKAICSVCICDLQSKCFNEKENTVTLIGTFDPDKVMRKLCRKAHKCILGYEVNEVRKKEEKPPEPEPKPEPELALAPAPEPEPAPAPPPEPEPSPAPPPEPTPPPPPAEDDGDKDKCKNGKKNGKKNGRKVVVLVVSPKDPKPSPPAPEPAPEKPPPPPDPKPEPTPPPPDPKSETTSGPPLATPYPVPALDAPAYWCTCGPCHCGCYYRACHGAREIVPCACACSYRHHGYQVSKCEFFSEEDSMCRLM